MSIKFQKQPIYNNTKKQNVYKICVRLQQGKMKNISEYNFKRFKQNLSFSCIGRLRMSVLPKQIDRFNIILVKIPADFFFAETHKLNLEIFGNA